MGIFSQPSMHASGGFFKPAEHDGHLILITNVHSIEDRYDQFKGKDLPAATVDVVDLDGDGGDQTLRQGVLMTHGGLVSRLSPGAHMVLGRIGKAKTSSGFEAWVLAPFDEQADPPRAQAWLDANPTPEKAQANAAPPAPAAPSTQAAAADPSDPAVQALLRSIQSGQQ